MLDNFCNLHGHSDYSSLDGFSRIPKLIEAVKKNNQAAIALTDHGSLGGIYKFYQECRKNDVNPILGIEAYAVVDYAKSSSIYHLTILAENNTGWENILKLFSISHKNFYYKPRMSFEDLFKHKEGIIVLSGCPSGPIAREIRNGNFISAEDNLRALACNLKGSFYIEVMDHGLEFQKSINKGLREYAKKHGIPIVATNDYHYCNKEDAPFQDYLVCDQLKQTIHEQRKIKLDVDEFYVKKREEMVGFSKEELDNTIVIANRCDVRLENKGWLFPEADRDKENFITKINKGVDKLGLRDNEEYIERINTEYKIIDEANLTGYFLVVEDYIKWAREQNILVGPGRGSVGGCLIGYLLGIHTIDPIKHKLLFSRFYNAGRKDSLPDVDTDFPENKRDLVKQYVRDKYGDGKVSEIGTYTFLHEKSALKLICRVLGVDFKTSNYYSNIIEDEKQTAALCETDEQFRGIVEKAKNFHGQAMYSSIHAAGMIISPKELNSLIPLRLDDTNGMNVSCWDMKDIEEVGLIKFDFLSLNTLDVIQDTLDQIQISLDDIQMQDEKAFNLINTTTNVGIFQLSSDGISMLANEMAVESIDDIAVVVALYRPGPMMSGLHKKYIKRKNGDSPVVYAHPLLEQALDDTYGLFVYQEQIIHAVMILGNFSEIDADLLRKAIGKKIPKLMKEQKAKFMKGCQKNKISKDLSKSIWAEIEEFAGYSFNRAHSVGYAYITYYTAYLKAHYPSEYMAAILNNNYDKTEKLAKYLKECYRMGIEVVPPSVTNGSYNFIAKDGKIIFGLKGIKGIGEKTAKEVFKRRYADFEDFCFSFCPNTATLVSLAEAGAFDEFGFKRNQIIESAEILSDIIKKKKKKTNPKAMMLFDSKPKIHVLDVEELPNKELASREYDRLNTYLVYNPLKGVDLACPDSLEPGTTVFLEGFLMRIKEHVTKKKETMAFFEIATTLGQIEVLVFPKLWRDVNKEISVNMYVAIEGKFEDKLLATHIWKKKDNDDGFEIFEP